MSVKLDKDLASTGTKFLLFPQPRFLTKDNGKPFKESLLKARDQLGVLLAATWTSLKPPDFLNYHDVFVALVAADREVYGGVHQQIIRDCFAWRGIRPAPHTMLLQRRTLDDCGLGLRPVRTV